MLGKKADVNAKDKNGNTPLIWVTAWGEDHTNIVQSLLDNGADVNIKNKEGKTALFFAKQRDLTSTIKLLEKSGAKE